MSRPELFIHTAFVEDALGQERAVTYTFVSVQASQSHPYGSTSATEYWSELAEGSERYTLDDVPVTEDGLQAALGPTFQLDKAREEWAQKANRVGWVDDEIEPVDID